MLKKLFSLKNIIIALLLTAAVFLSALTAVLFRRLSVYAYYISPYDYLKMETPPIRNNLPSSWCIRGLQRIILIS